MFERHEKWFVLGIIALVIYYFYKKGKPAAGPGAPYMPSALVSSAPDLPAHQAPGSIVNTFREIGTITPAQTTSPTVFRPAQPATVPVSQRISAGQFTYAPSLPILRGGFTPRYLA